MLFFFFLSIFFCCLLFFYSFFFFFFFFYLLFLCDFFFFFSSRRRHTRCLSDWSSDVCSSDLFAAVTITSLSMLFSTIPFKSSRPSCGRAEHDPVDSRPESRRSLHPLEVPLDSEIGRASCRERGWSSEVVVA